MNGRVSLTTTAWLEGSRSLPAITTKKAYDSCAIRRSPIDRGSEIGLGRAVNEVPLELKVFFYRLLLNLK